MILFINNLEKYDIELGYINVKLCCSAHLQNFSFSDELSYF